MSTQIVHEAENSRQHARYNIPVKLLFDGKEYTIEEWSVSGFSIKDLPKDIAQNQNHDATLVFDFSDFATNLDVQFEVIWHDEDSMRYGCRFTQLAPNKLSVLYYVINAYLAGEVVSTGDLINVLRRGNYSESEDSTNKQVDKTNKRALRVRQIIGYLVLLSIVVALLSFIAYSVYQRIYVIESLSAKADAPVIVVRAPLPSYLHSLTNNDNSEVKKGELVALAKLIGGGSNSIESPCDCKVVSIHAIDRQFVDRGEPIMTLLPVDAELHINAKVSYPSIKKLTIGQTAEIRFADGQTQSGIIRDVRASKSVEQQHAAPLANIPSRAVEYADVIIEPVTPLDSSKLGVAVNVKIDTYASPAGNSR